MTKAEAKRAAKDDALFYAIECLRNRLDGDITDPIEREAYEAEITRMINQRKKWVS